MNRLFRPLSAGLLMTLLATTSALADFQVTIGDLMLTPGQTGTVNVTIAGTASGLTSLDSFAFRLMITPNSGTQTQLAFTSAQPQPYNNPNYVFSTTSENNSDPTQPSALGSLSRTNTPNDTYNGGDSAIDGNSTSISNSGKLLLTFQVTAATMAPPKVGDSFRISLVQAATPIGGIDNYNSPTYFTDNVNGTETFVRFTSTAGQVSVVPEPSSLILLGFGLVARCLPAMRRQRPVRRPIS